MNVFLISFFYLLTINDLFAHSPQSNLEDPCFDRAPLLKLIRTAQTQVGFWDSSTESVRKLCRSLPTWSEVQSLYGTEAIIAGMDTCADYLSLVEENRDYPRPRIAGLYNSGTNALDQNLRKNLRLKNVFWDANVPWGKHLPPKYRLLNTYPWYNMEDHLSVLPIVIIRDPYRWMISMCKKGYSIHWQHGKYCPNLIKEADKEEEDEHNTVFVRAAWDQLNKVKGADTYGSLADLWSEWYRDYFRAEFPRLLVRFEDVVFRPEQVIRSIAKCVKIPLKNENYQYILKRSKWHGNPANLIQAMQRFGTENGRYGDLQDNDLRYARAALDSDLMEFFHYPHP